MYVLIVEDNASLAANVGEFLDLHGHTVDFAADGLTGLHLCTVNAYDAVVLDVMLPGLDGTSLCRRLRQDGRNDVPVLMLSLLTVSNHRPYKFPEGEVKWDDSMGGRSNTVRYADWAFGDFIERARSHTWFDDTLFIFVADHGHKVNGAADVPLHRYRIPMLFYTPKHIAPRRVDTLTAQIDLAPTLFGLLGLSYESNFFGIDALRVPPGGGRIAVAHNFSVAFAVPGHAVVLHPDGEQKGYRFQPGDPVLAARASALPRGRCFPGGHSSGGFALLSIFFVARARRWRRTALFAAPGAVVGSVFAVTQWLRGAHFPSHDLWSAAFCWLVAWLLYEAAARWHGPTWPDRVVRMCIHATFPRRATASTREAE